MLAGPLPELLDHRKLANQQGIIEGSFPVKQLERFGEMLVDQAGDVNLKLEFSKGERDRTEVIGHLEAEVRLECQSCLQPVTLMLASDISVIVVKNEAASAITSKMKMSPPIMQLTLMGSRTRWRQWAVK